MASMFTEDYHAFTDENIAEWKKHFSDEEFVELGAIMAHAHGFGCGAGRGLYFVHGPLVLAGVGANLIF